MEQLVILIVIAAISLINWLLQKSAEHKAKKNLTKNEDSSFESSDRPAETVEQPRGWVASDSEVRKFFEALGVPQEDVPPVVAAPVPSAPPPVPFVEQPVSRHQQVPEPKPRHRSQSSAEMRELASRFRTLESQSPAESTPSENSGFRQILSNPISAREAIVLREILGPPRALDPH